MKLMKEIIPQNAKYQMSSRCAEFALEKVRKGSYWDRLLEDKRKQHWLKVDFQKWKDEDDSEDENAGGMDDMEKRISTMKDVVKSENFKDEVMDIMQNMSMMSVEGNMMKIPEFHLEYAKRYKIAIKCFEL